MAWLSLPAEAAASPWLTLALTAAVRAQAASWRTPTLLLYAGDDRAVSPRGSKEFASAAPQAVVRAECFPQMYHEIFNEPDAEEVFRALETALAALG
ncbi:MAG: hypothetical protein EBR33_05215 [Synechococcaceae bacterium WB4_1_0192]|nr:hypothetical protein [Synechococcaceae bacterium WB4_1_0192]